MLFQAFFLKVSTLSVLVANTAVMFAVAIVFTREGLREVTEVALGTKNLDWRFQEVTK